MSNYNIKRILVPVDFSTLAQNALHYAEMVAKPQRAEVELLHIVEHDMVDAMLKKKDYTDEYYKFLLIEAKIKLKKLTHFLTHNRVSTFFSAKLGIVSDSIVETALENKSDLIVMGYYNNAKSNDLSYTTMNIIRRAPCPIIAVQPDIMNLPLTKIVVPIRNQPGMLEKLKYTVSLLKNTKASVHLVVFYPHNYQTLDNQKIDVLFAGAQKILNDYRISHTYTAIMGGKYVNDTLLVAKKQEANLIVILASQSGFIKRLLSEPDEEKFLKKSAIPIMTIPVKEVEEHALSHAKAGKANYIKTSRNVFSPIASVS